MQRRAAALPAARSCLPLAMLDAGRTEKFCGEAPSDCGCAAGAAFAGLPVLGLPLPGLALLPVLAPFLLGEGERALAGLALRAALGLPAGFGPAGAGAAAAVCWPFAAAGHGFRQLTRQHLHWAAQRQQQRLPRSRFAAAPTPVRRVSATLQPAVCRAGPAWCSSLRPAGGRLCSGRLVVRLGRLDVLLCGRVQLGVCGLMWQRQLGHLQRTRRVEGSTHASAACQPGPGCASCHRLCQAVPLLGAASCVPCAARNILRGVQTWTAPTRV